MSLYALKPRFQALLRPLVGTLYRLGVTANQVTAGTCIVSLALGVWLTLHVGHHSLFLLLPVWFLLRMALNAVDGMLAREHGQASKLGAYLNELTDVISDAALYTPFAFLPGAHPGIVAALILLSTLAEMTGLLGAIVSGARRHDGPMGKSDRALAFGVIGLLVGCGVDPLPWIAWALASIALLVVVTIVNRVQRGMSAR